MMVGLCIPTKETENKFEFRLRVEYIEQQRRCRHRRVSLKLFSHSICTDFES